MAALFGGGPKTVIPEFTGLQINTAVNILPIPMIYGKPRVSINIIGYDGFRKIEQEAGKGGGGKGGTTVTYRATFLASLGEGPITAVNLIYQDQAVWTPDTYPTNGSEFYAGLDGDGISPFMLANYPNDARAYKDTSYFIFIDAELDSTATIPQINMVPCGKLFGSCPLNNSTIFISQGQYDDDGNPVSFIGNFPLALCDADPAAVIYDFLTNDRCGAGFPAEFLADIFTTSDGLNPAIGDHMLSTYCQAVGFGFSVVLNNPQSGNSTLENWSRNLVVAPCWNGEVLRFIPYYDSYCGNNPGYDATSGLPLKYFQPDLTLIATIQIDNILKAQDKSDDPITFDRKDPAKVYNNVRLSFKDRFNFFNDTPVQSIDEVNVEINGPRTDNLGDATAFTHSAYAQLACDLTLARNISIRRTYTFRLSPLWGWLEPMQIFEIPDPSNYDNYLLVRVVSVTDDADGICTIEVEEFPIGSMSPTPLPATTSTPSNQGATNPSAASVYPPVIMEPTSAMLTATSKAVPQIILGAAAGYDGTLDPNWGGANVYASIDGSSYKFFGTLTGPSQIGVLAAPLAAYGGSPPDNTNTLSVDLTESDGVLTSVDPIAAQNGASLCIVKDATTWELMAYTTSTYAGSGVYNLTSLYRGMYSTTSRAFSAGAQFLFLGVKGNFFETAVPPQYVGNTIYIKLQSFNLLNTWVQPLSDCAVYTYTVTGPISPGVTVPLLMPTKPFKRPSSKVRRIIQPGDLLP